MPSGSTMWNTGAALPAPSAARTGQSVATAKFVYFQNASRPSVTHRLATSRARRVRGSLDSSIRIAIQ